MEWIDTHTHIADEAFRGDEEAVIARAVKAGVTTMIQADIDSQERGRMLALTDSHPGVLRPMAGLYPGSVTKDWQDEVDKVIRILDTRKDIVAVGEIGLDYHYGKETAAEQKEALRVQLETAAARNLPVNIHLRDATEDFFEVLEGCRHLGLRGNVHAFSGSYETFARLSKYGDWSVGIGGVLTFKHASLQGVAARIPLDRIVLETDAPYLTPTPHRGERNESAYIPLIGSMLAGIRGISVEEVAEITTANARRLFALGDNAAGIQETHTTTYYE